MYNDVCSDLNTQLYWVIHEETTMVHTEYFGDLAIGLSVGVFGLADRIWSDFGVLYWGVLLFATITSRALLPSADLVLLGGVAGPIPIDDAVIFINLFVNDGDLLLDLFLQQRKVCLHYPPYKHF